MSDAALALQGVSKSYPLFDSSIDRLAQLVGLRDQSRSVLALRDIDLVVERGQIFGIVGKNGSGKSTLLRLISGVLAPTTGSVQSSGKVAALLELGAGFNPEFSGRDNVLIACALLGIDEATAQARLPDIEAFADVGAFFDRPVKTYSTGMYARVAFAALAVCEPDILILDEILAVGDEAFQRKCLVRIEQLAAQGCTIILVTHNSQLVIEFCHAAALLSNGELVVAGSPKTVVHEYYRSQGFSLSERSDRAEETVAGEQTASLPGGGFAASGPASGSGSRAYFDPDLTSESTLSYGNADAVIDNIRLVDESDRPVNVLPRGERFCLCYRVTLVRPARSLEFGSLIKTTKGVELGGLAFGASDHSAEVSTSEISLAEKKALLEPPPGSSFDVRIPFSANLLPGTYFINAGVRGDVDGALEYLHRVMDATSFRILEEPKSRLRGLVDLGIAEHPPSFLVSYREARE